MPSLALDLALALDGVTFAEAGGIACDAWQSDLLRSPMRQMILNCSRQSGKSTVSSVLGLHTAIYEPGALVLLLAPALRQAQELFRKIKVLLGALGDMVPPVVEESALRLEFEHGSRIVCLPGKEATIRGFSAVSLLIVDEASRVADTLYQAVRPMLAISSGRLVLLSTPWGCRGFFHHEWTEGGPAWHRVRITAEQCPRIPPAFLAEERRALPDLVYRSEYECQFVDVEDQVFGHSLVMDAISPDIEPLWGVVETPLEVEWSW